MEYLRELEKHRYLSELTPAYGEMCLFGLIFRLPFEVITQLALDIWGGFESMMQLLDSKV